MKLMIGICTRGNDLYYKLFDWLMPYINQPKIPTEIVLQLSPYAASYGQKRLFNYAVERDVDYLLMVDSDIGPPVDCLTQMLFHKKDIITIPIWHCDDLRHDIHYNVSRVGDTDVGSRLYSRGSGLERIKSASFGILLINRNVLRKFVEKGESFVEWSPLIEEKYKQQQTDMIFFLKADKLGIESYVDWDVTGAIHSRVVELCDKTIENIRNKR